ncbi:Peptidase S54, rhomboid domain [Dillenia turbinata]|uniref:Peptidase S54, rhomboid domain n=1 Tax=Dillenia turbinata TaxID=194707 RepID=A0AAN8YXR5_9MAGN
MERGGRGGRISGVTIPILVLHAANEFNRLHRKPLVTAGLLAANTLVYLRPGLLDSILPSLEEVWFNPHIILKYRDLKRFFLSPFYHMGESHLFYNMMSLLWKGIQLESSMGRVEFASMVFAVLVMSQGITLLLAKSLLFIDYERAYYSEYSAGFSGILFAMKVILNSQSENSSAYVHGIIVPARYAAWVELILIQMFVPGVSFLGHLGGILAGISYLWLRRTLSGSDPLTVIFQSLAGWLSRPLSYMRNLIPFRQHRIFGRGTTGRVRPRRSATGPWSCRTCTFENSGWLSRCEMCGSARNDDGLQSWSSDWSPDLALEELRRRRIDRFDG